MNWRYYNNAAVPECSPHEIVDTAPVETGEVWKIDDKKPLFASWITDFDCGYETGWWYVIKDDVFDISALKAKRRYEITKGAKSFEVRPISAKEYVNELYEVLMAALEGYPEKYRPTNRSTEFWHAYLENCPGIFFGAFLKDAPLGGGGTPWPACLTRSSCADMHIYSILENTLNSGP